MDLSIKKLGTLNKNILLSAIIKACNIFFVVFIVRRSIDLLGIEEYGIWTAITSISMWVSLLDIGIGNGLRVGLRQSFLDENWQEARVLLNSAYKFMGIICLSVWVAFVILWLNTDWLTFFNIKNYSVQNVSILVLVTIMGLVVQLFFSLIQPVLNANLHSGFEGFCLAAGNGVILFYLLLVNPQSLNILQYGMVSAFAAPTIYGIFSFFYFKKYLPQIMPDFKEMDFGRIKPILTASGKFFVIQISCVLLYQMTSFLIIKYFSPTEVAQYNVAFRYFNLFSIVFMTMLSPLWSMSTDAFLKGDISWITQTVRKYVFVFGGLSCAMILGYFVRDWVFQIWLNQVSISPKIAFYVAINTAIICWSSIFLYVVTGAGKINLQFMLAIFNVLAFFPLTHFLVKILNWGIDGIFLSNIFIWLLIPIQAYFILKTDKKSYWLS
jgi:O-antigen/teichoic acid export membrane protein